MERKVFEFKGSVTDAGELSGMGAAYGNVDLGGDILEANSCVNIDQFLKCGALMVGHDWDGLGVGYFDQISQDGAGLYFTAKYHSDDRSQAARTNAMERLAAGKFVGMSIGYAVKDYAMENQDGRDVRRIKAWEGVEISQVFSPMNPLAGATQAKSVEAEFDVLVDLLRHFNDRIVGIKAMREKDGRALSNINLTRLAELATAQKGLATDLESLLAEPPAGSPDVPFEVTLQRMKMSLAVLGIN